MSAFEKLGGALRDLQETLLSLAPGGLAHRSVSGSSPITPLFFFCAFTLLAAVSLGVFSDNCWLQLGAFSLFAATLVVGMGVYLGCLFKRPDLLRSENFTLATRSDSDEKVTEPVQFTPPEGQPPVESVGKGEDSESKS